MAKKKKVETQVETLTVRITGPHCWLDDRLYKPGETATVPAQVAEGWISAERAVRAAEVQTWPREEH